MFFLIYSEVYKCNLLPFATTGQCSWTVKSVAHAVMLQRCRISSVTVTTTPAWSCLCHLSSKTQQVAARVSQHSTAGAATWQTYEDKNINFILNATNNGYRPLILHHSASTPMHRMHSLFVYLPFFLFNLF